MKYNKRCKNTGKFLKKNEVDINKPLTDKEKEMIENFLKTKN
jgi:predicted SprT family Zn-dependent metalloprotease